MLKLEKESIAVLSGKEMSQVNGGSIKSFFKKLFTKARYCLNGGGDVTHKSASTYTDIDPKDFSSSTTCID